MWIRGVLLAALMLVPSASGAERYVSSTFYVSGGDLLRACKDTGSVSEGVCLGYIMGTADAMANNAVNPVLKPTIDVLNTTGSKRFLYLGWQACFPENVSGYQARAVVIKWLEAHSEMWHYSADSLVAHALSEAFPCK